MLVQCGELRTAGEEKVCFNLPTTFEFTPSPILICTPINGFRNILPIVANFIRAQAQLQNVKYGDPNKSTVVEYSVLRIKVK